MNLPKLITLLSLAFLSTGKRAAADDDTASRLATIQARMLDSGLTPSVHAELAELDQIEPLTALDSAARGRVMQLRFFVENKGYRAEDAIRHGQDALRIETLHPFLDPSNTISLHYVITRLAETTSRCGEAIPHYRVALPLMAQVGASPTGVLGTWQRLAFCLHKVGQFVSLRRRPWRVVRAAGAWLRPPDRSGWRSAVSDSRAAARRDVLSCIEI